MSLNQDATIKIRSIIETLEREEQNAYSIYFKADDDLLLDIAYSIRRNLETYHYIYQLIIKDANKN